MNLMTVLELCSTLMIAAILVVEILDYLDQRKIVAATLAFWNERSRWYASRGKPREANLLREVTLEAESQPSAPGTAESALDSGTPQTPGPRG